MTTTPKQEAHTATPWHIGMRSGHNASQIYAHNGKTEHDDSGICQVYGIPLHTDEEEARKSKYPDTIRGLANAAFIVRACNSHDALVAALAEAVACHRNAHPEPYWMQDARRALELARTPTPGEKP